MKKKEHSDSVDKNNVKVNVIEKKLKILVAEDDPGILDIFKIVLGDAGFLVQVKTNGRDLINNRFDLPHLFILDKQLPGASGLDICVHLKSQEATKEIPVIIVSAAPDIAVVSKQAGADDCVKKPFDINQLLNTIRRHLPNRYVSGG